MPSGTATKLVVSGLGSIADARQVETVLAALPGVYAVRVDPSTRVVLVRHESLLSVAQLISAVEGAGYGARRAVPGEGSAEYASSPWGALRPEGPTQESEMGVHRTLAGLGALLLTGMLLADFWLWNRSDHRAYAHLVLGTVAQAILGWCFYVGAWRALMRRRIGSELLVSLATTAIYLRSVYLALRHSPDICFFLITAVLTAMAVGRWCELWLRIRAGRTLRDLVDMAPLSARVMRGSREEEILACDLLAGDLAVVRPGDRFPADGMVVEGRSAADESMLTGEALPMPKHPGAQVLGGTVNGHGRLVFRVSRVAADTALARMIQLVRQANETRPALARVAERLNFLLGPGAVLLACGVVIGCSLGFPGADFDAVLRRAAAVLLAACPAALALAVPTALSASLGRAARLGILIRSGGTLEACYRLKAVIFDRTGTLTLGRPEVLAVVPAPGKEEAKVLALAAGASAGSDYSLDLAVLAAARAEGIGPVKLADTGRIPGRGRCGRLEGHEALLGSRRLMDERGVYLGDLASAGDEQEAGGYKVQFFSVEGTAEGMLVFEDPLKPGARHTVERVREMGIATGMMTGDGAAPARAAAAAAGMGDGPVIADVRPEDRPMKIREVRESVGETAMIGDAVADGPALAEADVGIALGCGAHVDVETADVVLVGEDLRGVLRALRIARRTMRTMRRNIIWAITFNAVVLPLAAFGLLPPLHAAVVMVLASLLVVTNSHQLSLRPGRLISLGSLEP